MAYTDKNPIALWLHVNTSGFQFPLKIKNKKFTRQIAELVPKFRVGFDTFTLA